MRRTNLSQLGFAPTSHVIRTLHGLEGSPLDHHFPRGKSNPTHTPLTSLYVVKSVSLERSEMLLTLIKAQPPFGRDFDNSPGR